jgi:DNA-binding LytR/AlgR family response regulator
MSTRPAGLAGLRILVVEDEFLPAVLIEEILRELRCDFLGPVSNLDAALAVIQRGGFDAALLDMNLKGRAVTPAAAELAARKVPFILVTGYPGVASDGPVMSSAPRIVKPFTLEQLAEAMQKAFATNR